jgi:ABC-type transport system involved in multi-copper enzyme maturation permease subunit
MTTTRERGWKMGLGNMLAKELAAWYRTRRWWIQCLLWLVILNVGGIELNIRGDSPVDKAGSAFLVMAGFGLSIAVISMAQDSILGEKHSGTAAWVLSKPLRRPAFILAKLIAIGLGILVTGILLPGAVAYFQLTHSGLQGLTPLGFAGALGLVALHMLFYLTLALMLATLFNGRGPVLGISLGILMSGLMIAFFPKTPVLLLAIMPWRLVMPLGQGPLAGYLALGAPLPTVTPIIATAMWCLLFTGVALWRFRREEF